MGNPSQNGCHLPCGITQCYLPPDTTEHITHPTLTPAILRLELDLTDEGAIQQQSLITIDSLL